MIYLELFWSFLKIGLTSFGGLSMIPLISSEMSSHGWMSASEVSDLVGIAEITPGPLGLNCATFAGMRTAGILGAVVANLGVLFPTFTICLLAAVFFNKFKQTKTLQSIMVGVRPACLGMILGICITLSLSNYSGALSVSIPSVVIGLFDAVLLIKLKMSIPKVIAISAALGILVFGVFPLL